MHVQIDDTLQLDGESWSLVDVEGGALVHPRQFGMRPTALHAGCTRGWYCTFEIDGMTLVLRSLTVRCADGHYPAVCGVAPLHQRRTRSACYSGLGLRVDWSGRLRIGQAAAPARRGGFATPRRWRQLLELELAEGELERIVDLGPGQRQPAAVHAGPGGFAAA